MWTYCLCRLCISRAYAGLVLREYILLVSFLKAILRVIMQLSVVLRYDPIAFFDLTDRGDVRRLSLLVAAFATKAQAIQQLALPSSTIREALESEHVPYWRVDIAKSVVKSDKKAPNKVQVPKWMDNEEDVLCPPISPLSSCVGRSAIIDG